MYQEIININSNSNYKRHSASKSEQTIISSLNSIVRGSFVRSLNSVIDSVAFQTIMSLLTIYILFADDIKMLTTDVDADVPFSIIDIVLMAIFLIELIMSSIAVEGYFLHFFFWLDLISIVTILLDIHWFYNYFVHTLAGSSGRQAKSISSIVKAGKSAKVAARAVKVLRVLRIIRLVRVSKLYKAKVKIVRIEERKIKTLKKKLMMEHNKKEKEDKSDKSPKKDNDISSSSSDEEEIPEGNNYKSQETIKEEEASNKSKNNNTGTNQGDQSVSNVDEEIPKESKIGKKLSDLTTQRVIVIILTLIIGIILFNSTFYYDVYTSMHYGITVFKEFSYNDPDLNLTFSIYVLEHIGISNPLIFAQVGYLTYGDLSDADHIRETQKGIYSADCGHLLPFDPSNSVCYAVFDERSSSSLASILNIVKTIFISIVLAMGTFYFNKDTTEMVLVPLENMIDKVKMIARNPIEAMMKAEKEEIEELIEEETENDAVKAKCGCDKTENKDNPLETVILQRTISKIGNLLAMSFGEAGSEIILRNMMKNNNGDINPFIPGKQIIASFCYITIKQFNEITDALGDQVMIFINEIAEIIHEVSSECCGNVNRNMGDSFLIVWKYDREYISRELGKRRSKRTSSLFTNNNFNFLQMERLISTDDGLFLDDCEQVNQLTDLALISYIKIMEKVSKSKKLDKYRKDPQLRKSIIDFDIILNFSFDLGWSIEGPIGSVFKIDASYISPYVKRVVSLEKMCHKYGVNIILSDSFVEKLSENARNKLRMIDILKETSSYDEDEKIEKEIGLFTIDLDFCLLLGETDISISELIQNYKGNNQTLLKLTKYNKRKNRLKNFNTVRSNPVTYFLWDEFEKEDEDFSFMRNKYNENYYKMYNEAFDEFQFGDWEKAKTLFEEFLDENDDDGPSQYLYDIMERNNFKRPFNWKGNRFVN